MTLFQERCEIIRNRVNELIKKAEDLYKIKMPSVGIRFDLRGRCAGQAMCRFGQYAVRFNRDMLVNESWDHILNDTTPHEVAHLVGFVTGWDRGHGAMWRMVCRELGGSGDRCHSEEVQYAKGNTYYYTTSTGFVVPISQTIHRRIQGGQTRWFKDRSKGMLNKACAWSTTKPGEQSKPMPQPVFNDPLGLLPKPEVKPVIKPVDFKVPKGASKADIIRTKIAQARLLGEDQSTVIAWAMLNLSMTRSLAAAYVKNNWNKA